MCKEMRVSGKGKLQDAAWLPQFEANEIKRDLIEWKA